MRRVLVTGASGFIGRHVLGPLVAMGFEVHATSRSIRAVPAQSGIVAHEADLLAPGVPTALVEGVGPTHLLHLAWTMGCAAGQDLAWVAASLELYKAFIDGGGKRAAFAGSCAEYDWRHETLHETKTPARPRTLYGCAKNAVRQVVETTPAQAGVSAAWARIFFTYGPHEPAGRLVSDVASALAAGRMVKTTQGQQERDYLYVADVAAALVALLDCNLTGTINIASGESVRVSRIVEILGAQAHRPELLAMGEIATSADEPRRLVGDVTRLTNELCFTPRYGLEDGLEATLAWWRAAVAH